MWALFYTDIRELRIGSAFATNYVFFVRPKTAIYVSVECLQVNNSATLGAVDSTLLVFVCFLVGLTFYS